MTLKSTKPHYFLLMLIVVCMVSSTFFSCKQIDVFEKNTPIPEYKWQNNFAATGVFTIADTISAYNIYVVLRHTDAYKYNNIWLNIGLQAPGDTMYQQKVDLALGTDASGWEGSGMNDIWEVRKLLTNQPRRFKKLGNYAFNIYQAMRDNPLANVLSAGLRIEKAN